ncbi:unnamed protein product [Hyaloperonospora brassicae]|uniref:Uncharacterized protein n=1 Tax=Hyaloperonospora brassicae TaxID=162125 RepID=A0AAV0TQG7_HYABA|nr:unnamed protein product [Hyaloperonospora brassicae]
MDVKRNELLRLVVALSSACKKDSNVLKDSALVDALEAHGRQIARVREEQKTVTTVDLELLSVSPVAGRSSSAETAEHVKQQVVAGERMKAADSVSKRRKLSLRTASATKSYDQIDALDGSSRDACETSRRSPSIARLQEPERESMDEWILSLQSKEKTTMMDPVDAVARKGSTAPTTVEVMVGVSDEAVMVKPGKVHQYSQVRRYMSPQPKTSPAVRPASPLKQLYRAASPTTVDLTASSASTMASYYDDMHDEYAMCPETTQRSARSVFDRTPSFDTMDWMPSYDDYSDEPTSFRSIAGDAAQRSPVSRSATYQRSGRAVDAQLNVFDLRSESSANVCNAATEGPSAVNTSPRVNVLKRKSKQHVVLSSTEVVMEVLYGIMEHNEKFTWLIDPVNQARVASLVEYHLRERRNGDMSMYEDGQQLVDDLRAQVDELIHENLKIKTENVQLTKKVSQSVAVDRSVEDLRRRLAVSEESISVRERHYRDSEATFRSELESKSKLMTRLQHDLEAKDSQIALLLENGAETSANSGDDGSEVFRLEEAVSEKDREICRLNLQLSTKRELIAEIAEKVARHLETTLDVSSKEALATLVQGLRLDMDMLLFLSVAEKQKVIDELRTALLSVQREVSELEARLAKKERDALQLKTKFQSMSSRLTAANVNMSRIQTENDRLVTLLREKQGKMHDLIEFLEGKEKQVMRLEERASLHQKTQLEHVVRGYDKLQC